MRIPPARHVSKLCQKLANVTAVARQGGNASPTLEAHPLAESRQERWLGCDRESDRERGADPRVSQVLQEQMGTLCQARAVRVALRWTPASIEVVDKLRERLLIHVLNLPTVPIVPMDEVF